MNKDSVSKDFVSKDTATKELVKPVATHKLRRFKYLAVKFRGKGSTSNTLW